MGCTNIIITSLSFIYFELKSFISFIKLKSRIRIISNIPFLFQLDSFNKESLEQQKSIKDEPKVQTSQISSGGQKVNTHYDNIKIAKETS